MHPEAASPKLAVVGAGPVGLVVAMSLSKRLPHAQVCVFDARPADLDVRRDARTIALSLGSIQQFERLGVWRAIEPAAHSIERVHVSQQQPVALLARWSDPSSGPAVTIRADELGVRRLGAVAPYGAILAPLQAAWMEQCAAHPGRLHARFGTRVADMKDVPDGVEIDAGIAERFDLAIVAEGGVFAEQSRKAITLDYAQAAWVGTVELEGGDAGVAVERFTPSGPAALLPLSDPVDGRRRAALVWCVDARDDPVQTLDDAQRVSVLAQMFPDCAGRVRSVSGLKRFPLGLNAERSLVRGRQVRIGNAAQTLHPVAGQGLNLGLRDAHELVQALGQALATRADVDAALSRLEFHRAVDRWSLIAATDLLARAFTWQLPGAAIARGLALAALDAASPLKSLLARRMMFGTR